MSARASGGSVTVVGHPLVQDKLTEMREAATPTRRFRRLLGEIAVLMTYEITAGLPLTTRRIETPLTGMDAPSLAAMPITVVPILRAGLGMSQPIATVLGSVREGHLGLARDPVTKRPVEYLVRLPPTSDGLFLLIDPMLATGNSAVHAVDVVKRHGVSGDRLRFVSLLAAPEGVARLHAAHPDVALFTAAIDSHLDANAYIVPGLGDAGDRMFGTVGDHG